MLRRMRVTSSRVQTTCPICETEDIEAIVTTSVEDWGLETEVDVRHVCPNGMAIGVPDAEQRIADAFREMAEQEPDEPDPDRFRD